MRLVQILALLLAPLMASAIRIVMSNDDGWAMKNIRVLFDTVTSGGHNVVLSAPADNKSGTGSQEATPTEVSSSGCEFSSCPPNSPPYGSNSSDPRLNYVNSYPVTAIKYGIQNLTNVLGGAPELALSGFNAGRNTGLTALISGTVGAAVEAVKEGIPAIAYSGSGGQVSYDTATQPYQQIYAELSLNLANALIASGTPYLPQNIWLNVNYADVTSTTCTKASDFKFIFTKMNALHLTDNTEACGTTNLPTEGDVSGGSGCYASVSVSDQSKTDVGAATQKIVLDKLQTILSCLPPNSTLTSTNASTTAAQATSTSSPGKSTASLSSTVNTCAMLLAIMACFSVF